MNAQMLLQSFAGGDEEKIYIEDVFSTYLRTGTGADVTVTNDIDMTNGYMLWSKGRSGATDHAIYDSARGVTFDLASNSTAGQTPQSTGLKSVSSNGYTIGSLAKMNTSGATYVDWCFREAPKFFKKAVVTKTAGGNATVDLSSLGAVGMVTVKRTDAAGDWYTWHRSLPAGQLIYFNQTSAAATLGHITVSGTTLTLVNGAIADGTYVVYAWAHDPSEDGIVQCGSFVPDALGKATVSLGFEPQYVMYKQVSGGGTNWFVIDAMRGIPVGADDKVLYPNLSAAEGDINGIIPTPTGFDVTSSVSSQTYIYLAVPRPNKPPTSGTQVYNAIARTGTGAAATVTGVGFAPDALMVKSRSNGTGNVTVDRLRGPVNSIYTDLTDAEVSTSVVTQLTIDGANIGSDSTNKVNVSGRTYINHFFRRAPGVMDVVCDTGTGAAHAIAHNLTKAPELIIRKSRSAATQWEVWHSALAANEKLVLNSTAAKVTDTAAWNSTLPTATQFTVGTGANVNANAATFVTYLFATLPGISKVGTYTGNGSSQNIECGFATGARFVLVKRTDSTGDWYLWDVARGILAANDPHLSLNTTEAEVTTDDSVDPYAPGFAVNQNAATNINVNGASYIFLSIA